MVDAVKRIKLAGEAIALEYEAFAKPVEIVRGNATAIREARTELQAAQNATTKVPADIAAAEAKLATAIKEARLPKYPLVFIQDVYNPLKTFITEYTTQLENIAGDIAGLKNLTLPSDKAKIVPSTVAQVRGYKTQIEGILSKRFSDYVAAINRYYNPDEEILVTSSARTSQPDIGKVVSDAIDFYGDKLRNCGILRKAYPSLDALQNDLGTARLAFEEWITALDAEAAKPDVNNTSWSKLKGMAPQFQRLGQLITGVTKGYIECQLDDLLAVIDPNGATFGQGFTSAATDDEAVATKGKGIGTWGWVMIVVVALVVVAIVAAVIILAKDSKGKGRGKKSSRFSAYADSDSESESESDLDVSEFRVRGGRRKAYRKTRKTPRRNRHGQFVRRR